MNAWYAVDVYHVTIVAIGHVNKDLLYYNVVYSSTERSRALGTNHRASTSWEILEITVPKKVPLATKLARGGDKGLATKKITFLKVYLRP